MKIITIYISLLILASSASLLKGQEYIEDGNYYNYKIRINSSMPEYLFSVFIDTLKTTGESTGKVNRIEIRNPENNSLVQTIKMPGKVFGAYVSTTFYTHDMNFDGYLDILFCYNFGSAGEQFYVWLYNPKTGKYKYDPQFDKLWDPWTDTTNHLVVSSSRGNAWISYRDTYHIENGKLILFQEEKRDRFDDTTDLYERELKTYNHKKLISIQIDTVSE